MGSGFKTFTAGSILTASDVQNYLQDQAVMVFGGTAARSSAIGTANFEEGMLSYLTDVDKIQVYNGTTWADVYPSATTSGLVLLNTTSFSAVASQSLPANIFSSAYTNYKIVGRVTPSTTLSLGFRWRVAGVDASGTDYEYQYVSGRSTTASANRNLLTNGYLVDKSFSLVSAFSVDIFNVNLATPTIVINNDMAITTLSTDQGVHTSFQYHNVSTAYDSITILPTTGNITGKVSVYGYNE